MKPDIFIFYKDYKKQYILNDIMAGLMVAIIALPLSIALGLQTVPESVSTKGMQMGINTSIMAGIILAFLGGSRFQVGGSTTSFVVIIYGYLLNPNIGLLGLQIATLMAGVLMLIMGITKSGKIIKYISHPMVTGFTTGIGLTLITGQIRDFFGLIHTTGSDFIPKVTSYAQNIHEFNYVTFLIGLFGLILILVLNKINRKIPSIIIAVIACTAINLIIVKTAGDQGVQTIGSKYGDIKAGFYLISFEEFENVKFASLIVPAIIIAILGSIESLLSAKVADGMTGTKHNPNQELLAQGVINIAASCFGGLPAIGAIARTSANINAGAKSSISGFVHSIFLLIMYFTLMDVIKYIPLTVFAAILISVSIRMCNFPLVFKILKYSYKEAIVLLITCGLTVFKNLIWGVVGGMVAVALINIPNYKRKLNVTQEVGDNQMLVKASGILYVFNIEKVIQYISSTSMMSDVNKITLDLSEVKEMDATASERIAKCKKEYSRGSIEFEIQGLNESAYKKMNMLA